jgi:cysteine synthase A
LLKLETRGPTGCVKDRVVKLMVDAALNLGQIGARTRIVEATAGAEAFALASVAASLDLPLTIFAPEGSFADRVETLRLYGAEIEFTPKSRGMTGALNAAKTAASEPDAWSPRIFENPANPGCHEATTGPEIWRDLAGNVDAFVAGVGSGGTFVGASRYLRRHNPAVELVAVEPQESPVLSGGAPGVHGIAGLGAGFVPKIFDRSLPTRIETVSTDEASLWVEKLARTEGLAVGLSTGANLAVAARYASRRENKGKTIVTVAFSVRFDNL